ncbi:MAG: DUF4202 family protein [Kofleriaceae bacterium]
MRVGQRLEIEVVGHPVEALAAEFPTIGFRRARGGGDPLTAARWLADDFDFWRFDRELDDRVAGGRPLAVAAPPAIVRQIAVRAQRVAPRSATAGPWFARVRDAHRALHDLTKPLVVADLDHAIDAWQWTLRLDPRAPAALQLAALLHDVERLVAEPDARIEHRAADYQAFKDAHAAAGARLAGELFARTGVPAAIAREAVALIAVHERAAAAPAITALNDADALSFFSLNSAGYLRYFGPAQTARKVAYTLGRMSAAARAQLAALRVPAPVREEIARHLDHRA